MGLEKDGTEAVIPRTSFRCRDLTAVSLRRHERDKPRGSVAPRRMDHEIVHLGCLGDNSFVEKLNILCLHGYHGSAETLRRQLAPLADGLDGLAEFLCVDAPSLAAGDFGWWHAKAAESTAARMDAGLGHGVKRYNGWQRSLEAIVSAFARQGPFDGVFGFSQGAALASLLVGLRSHGGAIGSKPPAPALTFNFAVMVGGFVSADNDLARLYDERSNYDLPSVHIIGRSDAVVPKETSLRLASKYKNPLILEHEGGHVISNTPQIRQGFRSFLGDMLQRKEARALGRSWI